MKQFSNAREAINWSKTELYKKGVLVENVSWQSTNLGDLRTIEIINLNITFQMEQSIEGMKKDINPSLPWAEDHFLERVSQSPLNPGMQYINWPYHKAHKSKFLDDSGKFSHTYMERIWPKYANNSDHNYGIRYHYGDFDDIVKLLLKDPYTRQAYLPIFFPEDTGCHHGERVPCTLGYQFLVRNSLFHINYFIRSCDAIRHFRNDIYFACRKALWLLSRLKKNEAEFWNNVKLGNCTFFSTSFHAFVNEKELIKKY